MSDPNNTFRFATRDEARLAAMDHGYDLDDLLICVSADKKWGWVSIEDGADVSLPDMAQTGNTLDAEGVCMECGEDAFVTEDGISHHVGDDVDGIDHDADADHVAVLEQDNDDLGEEAITEAEAGVTTVAVISAADLATPDAASLAASSPVPVVKAEPEAEPAEASSDAAPSDDPVLGPPTEEREAEPGDLVMQINGPMLPAAAKLRAQQIAKKLGLKVTLRDATTLAVVAVVKPASKGRRGGSGRVDAPTEGQQIFIDLCLRPEGATTHELHAAGAHGGANEGTISWSDVGRRVERFGYKFSKDRQMTRGIAITVYRLERVDASNDTEADDLQSAAD